LVPSQRSTGGKRITKRGDEYLRTLLIQVAKSAVMTSGKRIDRINLFDLFMAPSSQGLEPPQIPGRFKAHVLVFVSDYNFAKHLKALRSRTPSKRSRYLVSEPAPSKFDPRHLIPRPNI
jgi:hypothetical protein